MTVAMTTDQERALLLEDEICFLQDSGELPEIAYHSSLHFLTADQEGPQLTLTPEEQKILQKAALVRCKQIVLRDLEPTNRDRSIYRGPLRSIHNWRRYRNFCARTGRHQDTEFRKCVAEALTSFLAQELADVRSGGRESSVNCSIQTLLDFAAQLELAEEALPVGWQGLCPE